ncbi:MAG: ABC transporter permease subunit [Pirellulales bacterium]|nr:ABC transporter permease subunit [Pirellulales bacterium]
MNLVLFCRYLRDSAGMLAACTALMVGFLWLRSWVSAMIEFDAFIKLFSEGLKAFSKLLPVPIEQLATPLGRLAFGYEEGPVLLASGLWAIARGSECLAGQLGSGTMEMLLAQPVRRASVVGAHTAVTLLGAVALAAAAWCGSGLGIATAGFADPPPWSAYLPASINLAGLIVCVTGIATLASAWARSRPQAVALVIGFYIVELALMIVARIAPRFAWFEQLTILSAYEPTRLVLAMTADRSAAMPTFLACNAVLYGVGLACLGLATLRFCRRDVPAPL